MGTSFKQQSSQQQLIDAESSNTKQINNENHKDSDSNSDSDYDSNTDNDNNSDNYIADHYDNENGNDINSHNIINNNSNNNDNTNSISNNNSGSNNAKSLKMNIAGLNCNSLLSKVDTLLSSAYAPHNSWNIICVQETNETSYHQPNKKLQRHGWTYYSSRNLDDNELTADICNVQGGTGIYISDTLSAWTSRQHATK